MKGNILEKAGKLIKTFINRYDDDDSCRTK